MSLRSFHPQIQNLGFLRKFIERFRGNLGETRENQIFRGNLGENQKKKFGGKVRGKPESGLGSIDNKPGKTKVARVETLSGNWDICPMK